MANLTKPLRIYKVSWYKKGQGIYVPFDPCAGGGYYSDLHGIDLVPAFNKKDARETVRLAYAPVIIKAAELIKTIGYVTLT
jgi:hypothetical protein